MNLEYTQKEPDEEEETMATRKNTEAREKKDESHGRAVTENSSSVTNLD